MIPSIEFDETYYRGKREVTNSNPLNPLEPKSQNLRPKPNPKA